MSSPADIDRFFESHLTPPDPVLAKVLENNAKAGLPAHDVSPSQGKLLQLYAKLTQAKRILEIGTLGGYSTIWMARALSPDGRLISLEIDPDRAEIARNHVALAELQDRVEIRVGPALESLQQLEAQKQGPFDLVFIDADKVNNPQYFYWSLKLTRKGSLILVDNVVRDGAVADPESKDPSVLGVRRLLELLQHETRVQATGVQTVGVKGWDGYILALVL